MISLQKLFEGCGSAMEVFVCPLFQPHGSPLACKGCESVLASVLLDASSTFPQFLRHAVVRTRWKPTIREQFAGASLIPLLQNFCDSTSPQRAQATNKHLPVRASRSSTAHTRQSTLSEQLYAAAARTQHDEHHGRRRAPRRVQPPLPALPPAQFVKDDRGGG